MAEESLAGKVAIVSGSAKGIGAATCVELATRQVFGFPGSTQQRKKVTE